MVLALSPHIQAELSTFCNSKFVRVNEKNLKLESIHLIAFLFEKIKGFFNPIFNSLQDRTRRSLIEWRIIRLLDEEKERFSYQNVKLIEQIAKKSGITLNQNREFQLNTDLGNTLKEIWDKIHQSQSLRVVISPNRAGPEPTSIWSLDRLMTEDEEGNTPLHYPHAFGCALSFLKQLPEDQLIQALSVRNQEGHVPLQNLDVFQVAMQLLYAVPMQTRTKIFAIRDAEGNTIVHNPKIYSRLNITFLLDSIDVNVWENNAGYTPNMNALCFNYRWLQATGKQVYETYALSDFHTKAQELKRDLITLCSQIQQEYDRIKLEAGLSEDYPALTAFRELFTISLPRKGMKFISPDALKEYLMTMHKRIATRSEWHGVPQGLSSEQLLERYSPILSDFLLIVNGLIEHNQLNQTIGILIGIARAEIEGRCFTAYQEEIGQAKLNYYDLCGIGNENRLSQKPLDLYSAQYLLKLISSLAASIENGNAHVIAQMKFLLGLSDVPDPEIRDLDPSGLYNSINSLFDSFDFIELIHQNVQSEEIHEELMNLIPEGYLQNLFDLSEQFREEELALESILRLNLYQSGHQKECIDKIMGICASFRKTTISKIIDGSQLDISETILYKKIIEYLDRIAKEKYGENFVSSAIENFFNPPKEEKKEDNQKVLKRPYSIALWIANKSKLNKPFSIRERLMKSLDNEKISMLGQKIFREAMKADPQSMFTKEGKELGSFALYLLSAREFIHQCKKSKLSGREIADAFQTKRNYDQQMQALADQSYTFSGSEHVHFSLKEHGRPSNAVLALRRFYYEREIDKLNPKKKIAYLLQLKGVLN